MQLNISSLPFETAYPTPSFGIEIANFQLHENISLDIVSAIKKCLAFRGFVLFRDQNISRREQVTITRLFGNPNPNPNLKLHSWAPPIERVTFSDDEIIPNGLPLINHGEILYFVNGPELCDKSQDKHAIEGGTTLFCDTISAYNDLDDDLKKRIKDLRVIHYFTERKHKRGALVSNVKRIMRRTQAIIQDLTICYKRDKSLVVTQYDGEDWYPYPFRLKELEVS